MRRATETDALIGPPEEIVGRLKQLQAGGVEYVMVIDVGGSLVGAAEPSRAKSCRNLPTDLEQAPALPADVR